MSRAVITAAPIDPWPLLAAVSTPADGAAVVFVGMVRDHALDRAVSGIDYTAYESMAAEELQRIVDEAEATCPGATIAAAHRLGSLAVTEVSIVVAAVHAHRAQAFEAARQVVEAAKRRLPVWKREHYRDGTREWVGAADAGVSA